MLIDARHPEETRVTVVKGSRVEEFDHESASKRPLKGNIYLARVTRVEPSLQAAFVEYGGNRHGFLAFSEIHPDYYQIPVEDRHELIEAETKAALERARELDAAIEADADTAETPSSSDEADNDSTPADEVIDVHADDETASTDETPVNTVTGEKESDEADRDEEVAEAAARRHAVRALKRRYNIQEVIKRRQVLLVQVVKEERGNKGAALTTYMSLAGRYCVLMPNSTHSGGISRKISNASDRRNLKKIISSLEVPEEMGLIVRTAGMERTKTEIKRDYDYLLRLWNGIRDLTLQSVAPALVYEEGSLIKRTIRDLYTRDIDEILVEGEEGYKSAKELMKLLMPSHAKKVQHYKDPIPLFHRYQVENHLEAMYQPVVQLKSGGYIVINPTEALISIDVNSGRATKEHNIEETALKTNLEAAEEVARQLRLRDMAGLVVIDFIDMEDRGNNRSVERRMKEVLKSDRARIQVGRISSFGLMEMSRQRLRSNLLEISMETCKTCNGTGIVRSIESAALTALRQLEEEGIRARSSIIRVAVCPEVAVYILNKKRKILSDLEARYELEIEVLAQTNMGQSDLEITREAALETKPTAETAVPKPIVVAPEPEETAAEVTAQPESEEDRPRRKRRRRRRRRRGELQADGTFAPADDSSTNAGDTEADKAETSSAASTGEEKAEEKTEDENNGRRTRRRRGSRGGRNRADRPARDNAQAQEVPADQSTETDTPVVEPVPASDDNTETPAVAVAPAGDETEKPRRRRRRAKTSETTEDAKAVDTPASEANAKPAEETADAPAPKPRRGRPKKVQAESASETAVEEPKKPARRRRTPKKVEADSAASDTPANETAKTETSDASDKPAPTRRRRTKAATAATDDAVSKKADAASAALDAGEAPAPAPKPRARRKPAAKPADKASKDTTAPKPSKAEPTTQSETPASTGSASDDADRPKRQGWWQRTFG
jgi:ribonuclease E